MNPLQKFNQWLEEELSSSNSKVPSACCLSTMGLDGFPNARFVALKDVFEDEFVVTGPNNSNKGNEIDKSNKVALTFWWDQSGRQVRIQGEARVLDEKLAQQYFSARNRESQIVSTVSKQSEILRNGEYLKLMYSEVEAKYANTEIPKPDNWGGWTIKPNRIEFLEFNESRFHKRNLFTFENGNWIHAELQP